MTENVSQHEAYARIVDELESMVFAAMHGMHNGVRPTIDGSDFPDSTLAEMVNILVVMLSVEFASRGISSHQIHGMFAIARSAGGARK